MSYVRVIPRDLFNEANLLKCYGRIYINLEVLNFPEVSLVHAGDAFDIRQDESSGDLYVENVRLMVRGEPCRLQRRLNSRQPWPLYLIEEDDEEWPVFNDDGSFSDEMMALLRGEESDRLVPRP